MHSVMASRLSLPNKQPLNWWSQAGSNRRPPACKAGALPAELWPRVYREKSKGKKIKENFYLDLLYLFPEFGGSGKS